MVPVAQELMAEAQDHRPVPSHQGGEGGFAGGIAASVKPLEELPVGQPGDGAAIKKSDSICRTTDGDAATPCPGSLCTPSVRPAPWQPDHTDSLSRRLLP